MAHLDERSPGPWHVRERGWNGGGTEIVDRNGRPVADVSRRNGWGGGHPPLVVADNARLLAAAPQLLEALARLVDVYDEPETTDAWSRRWEQALEEAGALLASLKEG